MSLGIGRKLQPLTQMDSSNHHVILRCKIEITINSYPPNPVIQQFIEKTVQQRIIPLLEQLFSQYTPADVVIHLDQLVIDSGQLYIGNLKRELPLRTERILIPILKEQIRKAIHNPYTQQLTPLPAAKLQAIAHYLSEGNFAWWITENSEKAVARLYTTLLDHAPLSIGQLWHNLDKRKNAIQRCIKIFSMDIILQTLRILSGQLLENAADIIIEVGSFLYQTGILTNTPYTPQQQLLALALSAALTKQHFPTNRISWVAMLLQQVAIQTATSYKEILTKLQRHYAQNKGTLPVQGATLKSLILQLHDMALASPKSSYKALQIQKAQAQCTPWISIQHDLDPLTTTTKPISHGDSSTATATCEQCIAWPTPLKDKASPLNNYTPHQDNVSKLHPFAVEHVVNFLINHTPPPNQMVPSYFIEKSLAMEEAKKIRYYLHDICKNSISRKKFIQHATKATLDTLVEVFVPFSKTFLDQLETCIMATKMAADRGYPIESNRMQIKEAFITAAMNDSAEERDFAEQVIIYLGLQSRCQFIPWCNQLIKRAAKMQPDHLVESFTLLKNRVTTLQLNKIDHIDWLLLPIHKPLFQLDKASPRSYYNKMVSIVNQIMQAGLADLSQMEVKKLVKKHFSLFSIEEQKILYELLTEQLDHIEQGKASILQRWHLFLDRGILGDYAHATALWQKVMDHIVAFPLEEMVDKPHIRHRLITDFTHAQLMALIDKYSKLGKYLSPYIQSIYQLWCTIQHTLEAKTSSIAKHAFWEIILKNRLQSPTAIDEWITQITTQLGHTLTITPITLLQAFQSVKSPGNYAPLHTALNRIQQKQSKAIQMKSISNGCPVLANFALLLQGGLSFFTQQQETIIQKLENELTLYIQHEPASLLKFLHYQDDKPVITRRIVYFFSQSFTLNIITLLAKEKHPFVVACLNLLSYPTDEITPAHLSTWQKELSIAMITYLLTTDHIDEKLLLHHTLLHVCYDPTSVRRFITSIAYYTSTEHPYEQKAIRWLQSMIANLDNHAEAILPNQTELETPLSPTLWMLQRKQKQKKKAQPTEIRVYTKNTGLIFLWPFLYDFFKEQDLLNSNQFFCAQAAHNAVYLLQYLVTGKLQHPEWQLVLPKLLCGLPYDEPLLPYRPLNKHDNEYNKTETTATAPTEPTRPSIAENSQELIQKVIKSWKNLTKLQAIAPYQDGITPALFSMHFLKRLGILLKQEAVDIQDEYWHLTMMQQLHDDLDLSPPWSLKKVKLPWMQSAIVLFWATR